MPNGIRGNYIDNIILFLYKLEVTTNIFIHSNVLMNSIKRGSKHEDNSRLISDSAKLLRK